MSSVVLTEIHGRVGLIRINNMNQPHSSTDLSRQAASLIQRQSRCLAIVNRYKNTLVHKTSPYAMNASFTFMIALFKASHLTSTNRSTLMDANQNHGPS